MRELRTLLATSLGRLSEREREVFVLRDLDGATTEATAEALGITHGTVRSLLSLARRRLRGLLEGNTIRPPVHSPEARA